MSEYRDMMIDQLADGCLSAAAELAEFDRYEGEMEFSDIVENLDLGFIAPEPRIDPWLLLTVEERADGWIAQVREVASLPELDLDGTCSGRLRRIDGSHQRQVVHDVTGAVVAFLSD